MCVCGVCVGGGGGCFPWIILVGMHSAVNLSSAEVTQRAHDVYTTLITITSMQHHDDVASTLMRRCLKSCARSRIPSTNQ